MVVLCIADGDGVVRGQPKHVEGNMKACRLAHTLRQRHDTAGVEDEHQRKLQRSNHVEQPWCLVRIGVYETFAGTKRNATALKLVDDTAQLDFGL